MRPPGKSPWPLLAVGGAVVLAHAWAVGRLWQPSPIAVPEPATPLRAPVEVDLLPAPDAMATPALIPPPPRPAARQTVQRQPPIATPLPPAPPPAVEPASAELPEPPSDPSDPSDPSTTLAAADTPPTPDASPRPHEDPPQHLSGATASQAPATPLPTWNAPPSARWAYEVVGSIKGFPYQAQATLSWDVAADHYDAQLELKAFLIGSRSQRSQGRIDPAGLVPDTFTDKARKERKLVFDWGRGQLNSEGGPSATPLLPPGTQDRLSLFFQLTRVLATWGRLPDAGQQWTIPVAAPGEVVPWTFTFEGVQTLELPAGTLTALKLQRTPRHPGDQRVELWFAPDMQHLPVRMRITQANGDEVDQRLSGR